MARRRQNRNFIPPDVKGLTNDFFDNFESDLKGYVGRCLFVMDANGTKCGRPVHERRHVIPMSTVLEELKDQKSGKVMELGWDVREWRRLLQGSDEEHPVNLGDPSTFVPRDSGTHDACARWFACDLHDNKFGPVDVRFPDFNVPMVRFLAVYRAVLCAADICRQRRLLHQQWNKRFMRSAIKAQRVHWMKETANVGKAFEIAHNSADWLGKLWFAREQTGDLDPCPIPGQVLRFRSTLKFAACLFYGAGVAVMVSPEEQDLHSIAMLYLADEGDIVRDDYERLLSAVKTSRETNAYGVSVVETMMERGNGLGCRVARILLRTGRRGPAGGQPDRRQFHRSPLTGEGFLPTAAESSQTRTPEEKVNSRTLRTM